MKALTWILTAAVLSAMLAYTVVKERPAACQVTQLSQVLR
jgi:hypothetical protein